MKTICSILLFFVALCFFFTGCSKHSSNTPTGHVLHFAHALQKDGSIDTRDFFTDSKHAERVLMFNGNSENQSEQDFMTFLYGFQGGSMELSAANLTEQIYGHTATVTRGSQVFHLVKEKNS